MGAPDHVGPGRQQPLDGYRRALLRGVGREPVRVAEARAMTLDVEQVLDREGQAIERPIARCGERYVIVAAEGTQGIVRQCPVGGSHLALNSMM